MSYNPYQTQSVSPNGMPDFKAMLEERLQSLESAVESGDVDIETVRQQLEDRFGEEAANEVIQEDGSLDIDKLRELIESQSPPPPPPPPMEGQGQASNTVDTAAIEQYLQEQFGEAADGVVGEDGTINFDKLIALLDEQAESSSGKVQSPFDNSYMLAGISLFSAQA